MFWRKYPLRPVFREGRVRIVFGCHVDAHKSAILEKKRGWMLIIPGCGCGVLEADVCREKARARRLFISGLL